MIPEGMRDVVRPSRATSARGGRPQGALRAYGYGEVMTPWLEFAETFEAAEDETLAGGYRLYDRQGHELVTRTDMTVPVARLAAARFDDKPLPLRFCYVAPSIRPWAPQRSQDGEFVQAGAELLEWPRRRPMRSASRCSATVWPRRACATSAWPSARWRSTARWSTLWASTRTTARSHRGACRPRLPAAGEHRRQLRGGRGRAQGPVARPRAQRLPRRPRPGAQAGDHGRHGRRHPPRRGRARPHRGGRLPGRGGAGLRPVPDLSYYSGIIFEAYAPGVGLPLASGGRYDGCWSASSGTSPAPASPSPWTGCSTPWLRRRWRRRRSLRCCPSRAPRGAGAGRGAPPPPAWPWPRFPRALRRRGRGCAARAGATYSRAPTVRWRPVGGATYAAPWDSNEAWPRLRGRPRTGEVLQLLRAAGICGAELDAVEAPALVATAPAYPRSGGAHTWLLAPAADVLSACTRGALDAAIAGKDELLELDAGVHELLELPALRDALVYAGLERSSAGGAGGAGVWRHGTRGWRGTTSRRAACRPRSWSSRHPCSPWVSAWPTASWSCAPGSPPLEPG